MTLVYFNKTFQTVPPQLFFFVCLFRFSGSKQSSKSNKFTTEMCFSCGAHSWLHLAVWMAPFLLWAKLRDAVTSLEVHYFVLLTQTSSSYRKHHLPGSLAWDGEEKRSASHIQKS